MTERPDLAAIEQRLRSMAKPQWHHAWPSVRIYKGGVTDLHTLIAYARALEKKLDEADKANVQRQANYLAAAGDCGP